jgi:hypothetical protein
MLRGASRPFDSPLKLGFQKRRQFVGRPELALSKTGRHNRLDRFQLFCRISANVDLRRGQTAVPQPEGDFADVLGCLQHDHGTGVPKYVGRDSFAVQR